jgi:transposase InsO family protein
MDSFTVDSLLGKTFCVLVIIELKTRKIIQFAITEHPVREFIRQQVIEFTSNFPGDKNLIHDRAPEFCCIDFPDYDIKPKKTSVKSPNLNSYIGCIPSNKTKFYDQAERVIGTIQRESLDWFIIFNRKHLFNILKEYVHYYNHYRPHQGIDMIPENITPKGKGSIKSEPIFSGLHNHCAIRFLEIDRLYVMG